ncbi:MAG: hypothetical protein A07HB70_00831 [uncultured archaeon A07HB70]|nr:MAG: hypothetical protein A07HB70_00831 [uncultured archaeon A07HB70]
MAVWPSETAVDREMSVSQHPVALALEQRVGGATRLLATVMALPLVDGIFPALVLAGALTFPFGVVETGVLIFGGSATVAVILAEMDGEPREAVPSILVLGAVIVPVAALEAALAPTIESLVEMAVFERFAGIVILTVAAHTASARVGEWLPRPVHVIGLGLLASVRPAGAELVFVADLGLILRASAAAAVGVGFALGVALLGPRLRGNVDLDRFRFGSAVALGLLALSVLGLLPTTAPVALFAVAVTAVFAYDPPEDDAEAPSLDPDYAHDLRNTHDDRSAGDPYVPDGPLPSEGEAGNDEETERAPWL